MVHLRHPDPGVTGEVDVSESVARVLQKQGWEVMSDPQPGEPQPTQPQPGQPQPAPQPGEPQPTQPQPAPQPQEA